MSAVPPNGSKILLVVDGDFEEARVVHQAQQLGLQFPGTQIDVTWDTLDPRIRTYQEEKHVVMVLKPPAVGKSTTVPKVNPLLKALQAKPAPVVLTGRGVQGHPFQKFLRGRKKR